MEGFAGGLRTEGYGPSMSRLPRYRLEFDGDESKYELWEINFLGHLRLKKLYGVISATDDDEVDDDKNDLQNFSNAQMIEVFL
ncbi:hypothetical protein SK128_006492 [Halocaridina rubra]|uniref:Uncharacterized protein n=1 Tax=Halocaridina rubra TaxID=373956 RepID=A0AAN9AHI4_HALRR